jgi:ketosteroid isomerase-like protein
MYRLIVTSVLRRTWKQIDEHGPSAAVAKAAPDMTFRFVGDTALGASLEGRDAFEQWFDGVRKRFPGIRFTVVDVVVKGWPWATTGVVRLAIEAPMPDGSTYRNEAVQFVKLRWGRMVDDWVLEDTLALDRALRQVVPA